MQEFDELTQSEDDQATEEIGEEDVEPQESEMSDDSEASRENHKTITPAVQEEMVKFEESFQGFTKRYKLIDKIGEGTFSTVYKAEDLLYDVYVNEWDDNAKDSPWVSPASKKYPYSEHPRRPRYVAVKKIYVTSSPMRIQNELELLYDLKYSESVCPLLTAFRYQDQVVAVLPYYRHQDFREFFRSMVAADMKPYFRSLFSGLVAVHAAQILHRDIKPTNFLYDTNRRRGVLVDFGLAEREGTDSSHCICLESASQRRGKVETSYAAHNLTTNGYPKNDTRPSKRANRAGTRGFRAPEVLLKCTSQSTKIDIWSAGVILLTILSRRFPFFNSTDDVDAMIEIASIFGQKRMKSCALLHGAVFKCTLPSVGDNGYPLQKLINWSTSRTTALSDETLAVQFLERCMELDPRKRMSAKEALEHEFLAESVPSELDGEEDEMNII